MPSPSSAAVGGADDVAVFATDDVAGAADPVGGGFVRVLRP